MLISQQVKIELAAKVCHEVNRAFCVSIGDHSLVPWADTPLDIKRSAINGVVYLLKNPDATPQMQHAAWAANKIADGWVYGETKDSEKKTHPCLVPYEELPQYQRSKDYLFQAVVRSILEM